jgi:hypothetical protein
MLKNKATLKSQSAPETSASSSKNEERRSPQESKSTDIMPEKKKEKEGSSESSEEESSTDSVDSDVARLLAKFDLETLHKIVEQLDDEVMKMSHCSKPDYVCAKLAEQKAGEKGDEGRALVPVVEVDESASVGSHSDSGISSSTRKRHLHQ